MDLRDHGIGVSVEYMRCAVVGGGINGVMSAWALARRGHAVDLYERGELMSETSSASTKLIHGGLRYLEHGAFRLVRESLHERSAWLAAAPHLVKPLEITVPIYRWSRRPAWLVRCGLLLYDALAGRAKLAPHKTLGLDQTLRKYPELRSDGLCGAFTFFDAQMDDYALGMWAAVEAARSGVKMHTGTPVRAISAGGEVCVDGSARKCDVVVNVAGPWAEELLKQSGISARHGLDLVRGSHLLLAIPSKHAFLVEVPEEERFCFLLPFHGDTLVGTTEVRQELDRPIRCSEEERSYLLSVYNRYLRPEATPTEIVRTFAGLRPLVRSHRLASRATREYAIERNGHTITVFGGKWTTARALAERVAAIAEQLGPVNC